MFHFYNELQTIRHRFNIYASSFIALALRLGDERRKLVTRYDKNNERFSFVFLRW